MAAKIKPIKHIPGAFSSDLKYDALGHRLAELAAAWRSRKDPKLVQRYQNLLRRLLRLGWDGDLDIEAELPDSLMPTEYFARYEQNKEPVPPKKTASVRHVNTKTPTPPSAHPRRKNNHAARERQANSKRRAARSKGDTEQ